MGSMLSNKAPWDLVADGYANVTMKLFRSYTLAALELLKANKQSKLLDVACGPGTFTLEASPLVASIHALDFSAPMINILETSIKNQGISNIETHCGDGQQLPYDDEQFDAAVSLFGLMFLPERTKGYQEILRTLKPGGKAVISSWAPLSQSPAMHAVFGALRAMNPNMPEPQEEVESLENPEYFQAEMTRAGFRNVDIKSVDGGVKVSSIDTFWEDMVKGSAPLVMLKQSMSAEEWQDKNRIAVSYLHDAIGSTKSLTAKAWLAIGTK